ncbi:MAG TPA: glycoside hydrolase family 9 protein [Mycobacteriales bacterium]|nr:glycoside hydrolase family 9 protein [Mycobacteriales bacterium]
MLYPTVLAPTVPAKPRSLGRSLLVAVAAVAAVATALVGTVAVARPAQAVAGPFNYAEALQKAVWFYDAQREGRLPADNRVSWRADSFLADGQDVNLDLTGGFADAGDHIKATFPLVHALTTLAWGMVDDSAGYTASGQSRYLLSNLRWGMDYLIKANPAPNRLVTEVADPNKDHQLWAAAEVQTYPRDTYIMTAGTCWGADLADSAASAFASASMVFAASDPAYAATLLTHARQLYATTEANPKAKYDDCTPIVKGFYNSWSGFGDELVWGSLWLYRATGDPSYLDRAKAYYPGLPRTTQQDPNSPVKYSWTYDWDDKTAASYILMAQLTGDPQAVADATRWADFNAGAGVAGAKVTTSPGGEAFYGTWGSLRYSAGAAWLALVLADSGRLDATRNQQLHAFGVRQINYILGDNPSNVSYLVGFGAHFITRPHHRTAHGSWSNSFSDPVEDRHTLYGGLIGGPTAADDNYGPEDRNAFQKAEVALDYNAGLTSALARLVKEFGGTPLASFPPTETKDNELFMTASLNQASSNFVEIKTLWYNHTAWPARFTPNISFRYYFTLDAGQAASGVVLSTAFEQCANPTGPTQLAGSTYYVTISCAGQNVGPIGQSESRRENQFRITFPGPHDYTKDWSFAGVSPSQSTPATVNNITMYDGGTLVWGNPPGPVVPPVPPGAPGKPTASAITPATATLSWTAATPGNSPLAGYDVWLSAAGGPDRIAASTNAATLSTVVSGLSPGTGYNFWITARDGNGLSGPASPRTPVTTTASTPPTAPGGPTASNVTSSSVALAWPASTAGTFPLARYEVYRVTATGSTLLASTPDATTRSATVTGLTPSTAYSLAVLARDTAGVASALSATVSVTTAVAPPASLKAQYKNNDSAPTDNQIKPGIRLVNGGTSAVALSTVTIRYYFTGDGGPTTFNTWCDFAQYGCANISQQVVALATPVAGADRYLEIGFTAGAGSLPAGATLGDAQLRLNKTDWSPFSEAADYSYAVNTGYADSNRITVYVGGLLVWGTAPA